MRSPDDDLSEIAGAGLRLTRPVVWAGTGGLVRALAARAFPERSARAAGRPLRIEAHRRGPILVVCGSASAVAQEQVSRLKSAGVDGFDVDAALLLDAGQAGARRFAASAEDHLRQGRDLVVSLSIRRARRTAASQKRWRRCCRRAAGSPAGWWRRAAIPQRRCSGRGARRRCASSVKRNRGSRSLLRPGRSQSSWRRRQGHSADRMPSCSRQPGCAR